jgi:hypothetical protein
MLYLFYLTALSSVACTVSALRRNLSLGTGSEIKFRWIGNSTTRAGPSDLFCNMMAFPWVDNKPAARANVEIPFMIICFLSNGIVMDDNLPTSERLVYIGLRQIELTWVMATVTTLLPIQKPISPVIRSL